MESPRISASGADRRPGDQRVDPGVGGPAALCLPRNPDPPGPRSTGAGTGGRSHGLRPGLSVREGGSVRASGRPPAAPVSAGWAAPDPRVQLVTI